MVCMVVFLNTICQTKICRRWSKIAKHLPGRTDNEIKNYWRTRIQKHMKPTVNFNGETSSCHNNLPQMTSIQTCSVINPMELSHYSTCDSVINFPSPFDTETNENTWSMEDLWSLQLLNND